MKLSPLDLILPGLTNTVDMATGVFREECHQKTTSKSNLSINQLGKIIIDLALLNNQEDIEKLFNNLKEESNLIRDTFRYATIQHKLNKYVELNKNRTIEEVEKIKLYLNKKPLFKKNIIKHKKSTKQLLFIRKKLIKDNSFAYIKTINGIKFEYGVVFTHSDKTNEYFYYYLMVLKNDKLIANYTILKKKYYYTFKD